MTILGCFLLSFTSYGMLAPLYALSEEEANTPHGYNKGQVNAFGVFQTYYAENQLQGRSASDISWIGSLQIGLIYVSGLVLGRFFDLHGSRVSIMCYGQDICLNFASAGPLRIWVAPIRFQPHDALHLAAVLSDHSVSRRRVWSWDGSTVCCS